MVLFNVYFSFWVASLEIQIIILTFFFLNDKESHFNVSLIGRAKSEDCAHAQTTTSEERGEPEPSLFVVSVQGEAKLQFEL